MSKLLVLAAVCASAAAQSADAPEGARAAILSAFDRHPLVAVTEAHRVPQPADFVLSLIRSPQFPAKANEWPVGCADV